MQEPTKQTIGIVMDDASWLAIVGQLLQTLRNHGTVGPIREITKKFCQDTTMLLHHRMVLPRGVLDVWEKQLGIKYPLIVAPGRQGPAEAFANLIDTNCPSGPEGEAEEEEQA